MVLILHLRAITKHVSSERLELRVGVIVKDKELFLASGETRRSSLLYLSPYCRCLPIKIRVHGLLITARRVIMRALAQIEFNIISSLGVRTPRNWLET